MTLTPVAERMYSNGSVKACLSDLGFSQFGLKHSANSYPSSGETNVLTYCATVAALRVEEIQSRSITPVIDYESDNSRL